MALSAARKTLEFVGEQDEISPLFTASITYYRGAVLVFTSGYAAKPTDVAALPCAGVVTGVYEGGIRDDAYAMGSTALRGRLKRGKVWLPFSGAAQTDVGLPFYLADDGTLTKTAGSKTLGFYALDFKAGFILLDLRACQKI
jgi:hypothetical protein